MPDFPLPHLDIPGLGQGLPMIRWVAETVALGVSLPGGLGFISFRPFTEKK